MLSEGRIGILPGQDGGQQPLRLARSGALIMAQGHASFAESVLRGNVMEAANAVAGVAPGTVLATTPPFALWNPPSSGKNLVIMKATMGYVSGTLGGGTVLFAIVPSQVTVPSGGAELVPNNAMIGYPRGVGRAFAGSTLAAVPIILRPSFVMGAWLATTATPPGNEMDIVDGGIVLPQSTVLVMQAIAGAGTSPLVIFSMTWEEVPA
jgi:hypothetical protein